MTKDDLVEINELVQLRERPKTGDKFALVSFDGYAITERGDKVKTKWFDDIDTSSNAYKSIMLTPAEAKRMIQAHRYMKLGASMQSLSVCYGPSICKRARTCEYCILQEELDLSGEKRSVVPVGKTCPLERDLFVDTVNRLSEEFEVEAEHYTDQRLILELAELEVIEARANAIIASDPDLQGLTEEKLMNSTRTKEGDTIDHYVKDMADLVKVKEKISNRKDKIRKELVATRREKRIVEAREGKVDNDPSIVMAGLTQLHRQLKAAVAEEHAALKAAKIIDINE